MSATTTLKILQAIADVGWEVMGHGQNNSTPINAQSEAEERELIAETVRTLKSATGHRPRGWLGPALCESTRTPDLLAEAGLTYVADWTNDEQPYRMAVRTGSMHSIPYSLEVNDFPAFLTMRQSAEGFGQLIRDYFDGLYEDGASTGRVMAICLHPFLTGILIVQNTWIRLWPTLRRGRTSGWRPVARSSTGTQRILPRT